MNNSSPILPDDCLKTLRVLSSDIFRLRAVKIIPKLIVSLCSTMSLLQLYFFFVSSSIGKLLKCGAAFFHMCYVTLRTLCRARFYIDQFQMLLSTSVLLVRNEMVDDIMKVILLCTVVTFFARDDDNGWTFIRYIFDELFAQ
jgi:hypothetical protein